VSIRGDLHDQPGEPPHDVRDQHHRLHLRFAQGVELAEGLRRVLGHHRQRAAAEAGHEQGGDDAVVHQRVDTQPLLPARHPGAPAGFGLPGEEGGFVHPGRGATGGEGEGHEHAHQ
jgi:hypothetical protein